MPVKHRRDFLYAACGVGSLAAFGALREFSSGGNRMAAVADLDRAVIQHTICHTASALGADVTITALHTDEEEGKRAVDAAFAEIDLVESLMSIYRPGSQLTRLNRDKRLDLPHAHLVEVLRAAETMSRRSDGAFDVTVQPLWEAYRAACVDGGLPDAAAIASAREKIDWRRVEIRPGRIQLHGEGTAVTLNGIAQGYAADRVVKVLRSHGVENALIDTGELGSLGRRQGGGAWTVGLQHPRHQDAYISLAQLAGRCLATSGDYASTFSSDFKHHHIFDPRTGTSPEALSSVSVLAPTAMEADALSTALFVLGPANGVRLLRETPGADALLVLKDGRVWKTPGFTIASEERGTST